MLVDGEDVALHSFTVESDAFMMSLYTRSFRLSSSRILPHGCCRVLARLNNVVLLSFILPSRSFTQSRTQTLKWHWRHTRHVTVGDGQLKSPEMECVAPDTVRSTSRKRGRLRLYPKLASYTRRALQGPGVLAWEGAFENKKCPF